MRVIEAAGVTLEPQVAAHADAMFAVLSDPAIYEHENAPPASVEALRERYRKLETRRSGDGREQWLNWVVRAPDGEVAGYVQATVYPDEHAGALRSDVVERHTEESAALCDSRSLAPPGLRPGPRLAARADIAYEFASRYWGRGLARAAVLAMIDELVGQYRVRTLSAVLKRSNERSRRFLERLGFALASPERHHERRVETDEMLMERAAPTLGRLDG